MEADNMCQWFGCELCAVKFALQQPQRKLGASLLLLVASNFFLDSIYYLILKQRHEYMSTLQERWLNPLASAVRYAGEARAASERTASLSGTPIPHALQWLSPVICKLPSDEHVSEAGDPDTIVSVLRSGPVQSWTPFLGGPGPGPVLQISEKGRTEDWTT